MISFMEFLVLVMICGTIGLGVIMLVDMWIYPVIPHFFLFSDAAHNLLYGRST